MDVGGWGWGDQSRGLLGLLQELELMSLMLMAMVGPLSR